MIKAKIKYLIFMIVLSGCSQSGADDHNIITTRGIYTEDENIRIYDMFLKGEEVYLLGGEAKPVWIGERLYSEDEALIFYTDDQGENWKRVSLGEGMFEKVFRKGSNWYALKFSQISESKSTLYRYVETSKEWELYKTFPFWIYDITVLDESSMLVLAKDTLASELRLYRIANKDERWEQLPLNGNAVEPLLDEQTLLYLKGADTTKLATRNILVEYDVSSGEEAISNLPDGLDAYLLKKNKGEVWLFGIKGTQLCLYKINLEQEYQLIYTWESEKKIFPKGLYISGNQILLWVGVRGEGYTTNQIIISKDAGIHWDEKQLLAPAYAGPVFIEKDAAWVYMGRTGIQKLK
jgi:hypothetical protein